MPIPMVRCVLCGQEVTRRSTRSLAALGAGSGRACRSHEEVGRLVEAYEQQVKANRLMQGADRSLRTIMCAAVVKVSCTLLGMRAERVYQRLRWAGLSSADLQEVKREINRQGGPVMSVDETRVCIATAATMKGQLVHK